MSPREPPFPGILPQQESASYPLSLRERESKWEVCVIPGEIFYHEAPIAANVGRPTVTLQVTGAFEDSQVRVEPDRISFAEDGEKIVRILAKVGKKMPADTDFIGAVIIPELDHRVTQFVLRKLGD